MIRFASIFLILVIFQSSLKPEPPTSREYHKALHSYMIEGDCEGALPNIEKAYKLQPAYMNVQGLRAQVYQCLKRYNEALQIYNELLTKAELLNRDRIQLLVKRSETYEAIDKQIYAENILGDLGDALRLMGKKGEIEFHESAYISIYRRRIPLLLKSGKRGPACQDMHSLEKLDKTEARQVGAATHLKCE